MPAAQRDGDLNAGGGAAQGGVPSVRVNNIAVMIPEQSVTAHPPYPKKGRNGHNNGSQKTAGGVSSVRAGNKPIVVTGDADTCGHARVGGSPDVKVGG